MAHSRVGISPQRPPRNTTSSVNCSKNSLGPRRSSQSGCRRRNGSFSLFTAILISSLVLCCFCSGLVTAARGRRRGKAPKEKSAEGAAGGEGESDLLLGQTSSSSKTSEGEDSVATEDEDLLPAGNKEFDGKEVVFDKGSRREAKQFWNVFPGSPGSYLNPHHPHGGYPRYIPLMSNTQSLYHSSGPGGMQQIQRISAFVQPPQNPLPLMYQQGSSTATTPTPSSTSSSATSSKDTTSPSTTTEKTEQEREAEKVSLNSGFLDPRDMPKMRVAETLTAFSFAEGATPEEEVAIVESVNKLIGAVGRQAINGANIFSEDDIVLPGRPNTEPFESGLSQGAVELGRPQATAISTGISPILKRPSWMLTRGQGLGGISPIAGFSGSLFNRNQQGQQQQQQQQQNNDAIVAQQPQSTNQQMFVEVGERGDVSSSTTINNFNNNNDDDDDDNDDTRSSLLDDSSDSGGSTDIFGTLGSISRPISLTNSLGSRLDLSNLRGSVSGGGSNRNRLSNSLSGSGGGSRFSSLVSQNTRTRGQVRPARQQAAKSTRRRRDCCLFVFFDGSAYYFDDYLRMLTGPYRLMYGTVNGHPHYVARGCKEAELYGPNCSYIWNSGYGWIIGIGTYIGQTKGVVYTRSEGECPTDRGARWRFLNKDLEWKDNGNIILECAS